MSTGVNTWFGTGIGILGTLSFWTFRKVPILYLHGVTDWERVGNTTMYACCVSILKVKDIATLPFVWLLYFLVDDIMVWMSMVINHAFILEIESFPTII